MDVLAMYQVTAEAAARARAGDGPTLIEALCFRYGPHATADDPSLYRSTEEVESWRSRDPIDRYRTYLTALGLWDPADDEALIAEGDAAFKRTIDAIESTDEPDRDDVVRHAYERVPDLLIDQLHTIQRRAGETETVFTAAERWEAGPDPDPDCEAPVKTMATAINEALHSAMEADSDLLLLGEDVGIAGGVFRITQGLHDRFGDERVIDTPINESGIVGAAIGMAISGTRAIAEIQFEGFVYPAFDQIVSHLGRIRFRSRGHKAASLVVRFPTGAGIGAHEHHCDSPEAYFMHAPGLVVVLPSTAYDAKGLLTSALRGNDPVIFMEPKVLYHGAKDPVPDTDYEVPLGVARTRREGSDLTLVSYGGMVPVSLRAAEKAAAEGISAEVIDLRTIYPWDVDTVAASVERTGHLLVVQEPQLTGGVAAEVAATIAERCGYSLEAPIRRVGATDAPWPQFAIERHALIDDTQVLAAIRETVGG
jgi:pyruvate/2-oxoglutarate/acetoin dehydrogenase E1 component